MKNIACSLKVKIYIYVCVCACVYMYIYIYMYIHTYTYTHIYIFIHTSKRIRTNKKKKNYGVENYWESSERYIRKGICTYLNTCVDAHRLFVNCFVTIFSKKKILKKESKQKQKLIGKCRVLQLRCIRLLDEKCNRKISLTTKHIFVPA